MAYLNSKATARSRPPITVKRIGSSKSYEVIFNYATGEQKLLLISYDQPVALIAREHAFKTDKKFSKTTSRHITVWLTKNGMRHTAVICDDETFLEGVQALFQNLAIATISSGHKNSVVVTNKPKKISKKDAVDLSFLSDI